jgi:hypothetical protein
VLAKQHEEGDDEDGQDHPAADGRVEDQLVHLWTTHTLGLLFQIFFFFFLCTVNSRSADLIFLPHSYLRSVWWVWRSCLRLVLRSCLMDARQLVVPPACIGSFRVMLLPAAGCLLVLNAQKPNGSTNTAAVLSSRLFSLVSPCLLLSSFFFSFSMGFLIFLAFFFFFSFSSLHRITECSRCHHE